MMAGGYSGQLVALGVNTPSETQLAGAQADQAQTQARVMRATAPAVIAQQQQAAKAGELALADQLKLRALQDKMWEGMQAAQQPTASPLASAAQQAPQSVQSPLTPLFDPRIEDVMDTINPDDPNAAQKWDAGMSALVKDVPQAKQFVGQFSKGSLNSWRAQMGAHSVSSPLASAGSLGGIATRSPLAAPEPAAPTRTSIGAISPLTGKYDPVLAEMSVRFPEKAQAYQAMEGMMLYQQTGNPEALKRWAPDVYAKLASASNSMSDAQKTRLATQAEFMGTKANAVIVLGNRVKEAGGDPNTDPKVRAAYDTSVQQAAKEGFITPQDAQARMSKPIDWAELAGRAVEAQTVTAFLQQDVAHQTALKQGEATAEAQVKAANPDSHFSVAGTDENGNMIVLDTKTGQPKNTGVVVQNKQEQFWQAKHDAWLAAHPGDQQGAVAFAGGKKDVSPTQMAAIAQANTVKQQANAQMMGQEFNFDQAYAANLQMLQQAQAAPTGPQPAAAAPAGGVPSVHGHPPQQRQAAVDFTKNGTLKIWQGEGKPPLEKKVAYNSKAPVGTAENPYFPANQAAYDKLRAGALFVGLDGLLHVKK